MSLSRSLSSTTYTANNGIELNSLLGDAVAGDVILLKSSVTYTGCGKFLVDKPITIECDDIEKKCILDGCQLRVAENTNDVLLKGIHVKYLVGSDAAFVEYAVSIPFILLSFFSSICTNTYN